ncbi:MAG: PD-(D/E)XK nuclease family protein [Clostridia bacterium]|nr:PD-(D/E)XK nuclease family protein [Clostridia bacterium]
MKTNFISSTNYYDAFKAVIQKINNRKVDLAVRHLLIVPERYTLLAEKFLYENLDGSFDVEVLSLSRLFYKMEIDTPLLSKEGAIMLIRSMLTSVKLSCFYRSAPYRGFCEKLYDAFNDFAANGVSPDGIPSSHPKLADLKLAYQEYLNRIKGRFVDSMGKLELIAAYAKNSKFLDNVHVYVTNFDYVDTATQKVFDELKNRALSYTESKVQGAQSIDGVKIECCASGASAVKEVAKRLRLFAYKGVKYEDMAVILGNADSARVRRIFTEFEVPFTMDSNKRLIDFALSAFLLKLNECAVRKHRDGFVELSKNVYSGVGKEDSDKFENYVNMHLVDYKGFYTEFTDCEECVEQTRKRLVSLVAIVEKRLKLALSAADFGQMILEIFAATSAEAITEKLLGSDAIIEKTKALVLLMEQVGVTGNFDFMSAVFSEGLRATRVATIPSSGVMVGDPAALRGKKYKFVAVLGFDDGFLPQIYDENSLIGDDEKGFFTQMERAEQINYRYEQELRLALAGADEIFATYTTPSGMMREIFECKAEENLSEGDKILLAAGSKRHAVETLISLAYRAANASENNQPLINALFDATESSDELFESKRKQIVDDAQTLFFARGTTSVSQLQSYFMCPFRHYAEYGLRLHKRETGELTPIDIGNFMHKIVELAVKTGISDDIETQVNVIVDKLLELDPKMSLAANEKHLVSLKKEATSALDILNEHLKKGKFKTVGQEIEFEVELDDIRLSGKIDMADEYDGYIRLIDYKTGEHEIKSADIYYGRKIQLPLYMYAADKKGYKKAAFANFPFSYSWLNDEFDHRFSGYVLRDDDVMAAMDCSQGESRVYNNRLLRNERLVTENEMNNIVNYAKSISSVAVSEIKQGYVSASHIKDACRFCEYKCLCAVKNERAQPKVSKSCFEVEQ